MKLLTILHSECTEMHESCDPGGGCRGDHRLGPRRVDAQEVGAVVPVSRDRHKVHDRIAADERRRERCGVRHVADACRQARRVGCVALRDRRCGLWGSREGNDIVSCREQRGEDVTPDETRPACEKDSRHVPSLLLVTQTL